MARVIKCCCAARWGFNFYSGPPVQVRLFKPPALLYFPQDAQIGRPYTNPQNAQIGRFYTNPPTMWGRPIWASYTNPPTLSSLLFPPGVREGTPECGELPYTGEFSWVGAVYCPHPSPLPEGEGATTCPLPEGEGATTFPLPEGEGGNNIPSPFGRGTKGEGREG